MAAKMLTDEMIRKINPRSRRELSDRVQPGLTIRITRRSRTWSFIFKPRGEGPISPITGKPMAGKQQRITLGTYPAMSVIQAREQARDLSFAIAAGKDPRNATADKTFATLANMFMTAKDKTVRHNSALAIRNALEKHVLPRWGKRDYDTIDRKALNTLTDEISESIGQSTGDTARKWAKGVFTWAVDKGVIDSHALAGVARKKRDDREQAGRVLSDSDIRAVWHASHDQPIVRLLLLTGCRRSEWSGASWTEINPDERTLVIPAKRYKTGVVFELPLVPLVWEIVESLPNYGPYLFGGERAVDPVDSAVDKVRARTPDVEHWSPHDLRRTCQTRLASMGLNADVYEAVLGHVKSGMKRHYNYHSYSAEKREALQRYADLVITIAN